MRCRESHGGVGNLKEPDPDGERRENAAADRHRRPVERFLVGRVAREIERSSRQDLARDPAGRDVVCRSEIEAVPRVESVERKRPDDEEVAHPWARPQRDVHESDGEEGSCQNERKKSRPSARPDGCQAGDERNGRD